MSTRSVAEPRILREGWLSKYGLSLLGNPGTTAQRRYCVLSNGQLVYYKLIDENKRERRGSVPLTKTTSVTIDQHKPYTFYITPVPNARVYRFETETEADCKGWVERIRQACECPVEPDEPIPPGLTVSSSMSSMSLLGGMSLSSSQTPKMKCKATVDTFLDAEAGGDLLDEEFFCLTCGKPVADHPFRAGVDSSPELKGEDFLLDLTHRMMAAVEVRDRWYFGRLFEKCFLGSEACAWLMSPASSHFNEDGLPCQRELTDAILLGNMLMSKGYFKHVTDGHPFKNERLFYRFSEISTRVVLETCQACEYGFPLVVTTRKFVCPRCNTETDKGLELEQEMKKAAQEFSVRKDNVERRGSVMRSPPGAVRANSTGSIGEAPEPLDKEDLFVMSDTALIQLADRMQSEIEVKDRTYRFRTYKQCFLGTDAVRWLRDHSGVCKDTEYAIMLGNLMMAKDLFQHVVNAHPLKNESLFYHFVSSEKPVNNAFFPFSLAATKSRIDPALLEDEEEEGEEEEDVTIRIYDDT